MNGQPRSLSLALEGGSIILLSSSSRYKRAGKRMLEETAAIASPRECVLYHNSCNIKP